MDLFGDRWQRAAAAHKALESFELDAAAEALREVVRLYPADVTLLERADLVARLAASLRGARRKNQTLARALAAIEPKVPPFLATYWHRRLAERVEEEAGAGAVLDAVPAGPEGGGRGGQISCNGGEHEAEREGDGQGDRDDEADRCFFSCAEAPRAGPSIQGSPQRRGSCRRDACRS